MKNFKVFFRIIFFSVLIGVSGYALRASLAYVRRIDEYCVDVTGNITQQVRQEVVQYVNKEWLASDQSFKQLCAHAKNCFACIKDIDIVRLPGKKAHVEVSMHEPLYMVNSDHVVTAEGIVLAKNIFEPRTIEHLYRVAIADAGERKELSPACKQSLAHLSPDFLDHYLFEWQNDNSAWLHDRNHAQFAILFHPLTMPAQAIIQHCDSLRQELAGQGTGKNQQKIWIADVRFKDQIIVSSKIREEGKDGTRI